MNFSEISIEVDKDNITNEDNIEDSQTISKKLMFLIEGVFLGIVAVLGITGKYNLSSKRLNNYLIL